MVSLIFYALSDCPANQKQLAQLEAAGHQVERRDLATSGLDAAALRLFFADSPVESWFSRIHPAIRAKTIDRDSISAEDALTAMLADPALIRRPLIDLGTEKLFGFDPARLDALIGLKPVADGGSCEEKHARGRCDHGHHHHH